MEHTIRHHVVSSLLVVFAAAIFVGPALGTRPDDRAGMLGVGAVSAQQIDVVARPDDRGSARGPGSVRVEATATRPDDRAGPRGPGLAGTGTSTTTSGADKSWFDVGSAALGAGFVAFLGLAGALLVAYGRGFERRPA